jgi:aprataxin
LRADQIDIPRFGHLSTSSNITITMSTEEQAGDTGLGSSDPPSTNSRESTPVSKPRNAFSELMSAKPKREPKPVRTTNPTNLNDPKNALLPYVLRPESYSPKLIINYTVHSVLIRDGYPKSLLHLLLLPRDPTKYALHPHAAFADPTFHALIKNELAQALDLATSELSRLLSPHSASTQARLSAMDSPSPPSELPPGRDFRSLLRVGVHAHPSMNHLHIHILTPDMHSPSMKHRKHYNSFNTDFFIPFEDLPLAENDQRREVGYQNANLRRDFVCWRCGKGFGNRFKELKGHLEGEFEGWRKE